MISLKELQSVKGIGPKALERIKDHLAELESDKACDSSYCPTAHVEPESLVQGDMLEVMKGVPDRSVDLILTDPPYGMDYQSGRRKEQYQKIINDVSVERDIDKWVKQCYRVLKEDSGMYMFCSWHNVDVFKNSIETLFNVKNIIVWNKNNHGSGDLVGSYAPKHEFIIYAHKGRVLNRGRRKPDVLDFARVDGTESMHPTQKPVDLLTELINNSSDVGDLVLDPFMGSGSTGVAAVGAGRKFAGIELDEGYLSIAKKRIQDAEKILDTMPD